MHWYIQRLGKILNSGSHNKLRRTSSKKQRFFTKLVQQKSSTMSSLSAPLYAFAWLGSSLETPTAPKNR